MRNFNVIALSITLVTGILGVVFLFNGMMLAGTLCVIVAVTNIINIIDIAEINEEDSYNDPGHIRRRAKHFLELKEKERREEELYKAKNAYNKIKK